MHYLVAVLPNQIQAEAAYSALVKSGLSAPQVAILGEGYKNPDSLGLIKPDTQVGQRGVRLSLWLMLLGFIAGCGFGFLLDVTLFPELGRIGNYLITGLLGAVAGAIASVLLGGGISAAVSRVDAMSYRDVLNAGKYLVVVQVAENVESQVRRVLDQFETENVQGYPAPGAA